MLRILSLSLVPGLKLHETRHHRPSDYAAAVFGIALPADIVRFLKAVEDHSDAAARKAGQFGKTAGSGSAVKLENAEHLQVGEVHADFARDLLVEQNRSRNIAANFANEGLEQGRAIWA